MRNKLVVLATLGLICLPLLAQADMVTKTFLATLTDGPLAGEIGTGSFSYDDSTIKSEDGLFFVTPSEGLTVTFTYDGQTFDESNDLDFDEFPLLEFLEESEGFGSFYRPISLDYWLVDGENGVNFNNPIIGDLSFNSFDAFEGSEFDYAISVEVGYVPIPGSILLLLPGLVSLVMIRNRRSH